MSSALVSATFRASCAKLSASLGPGIGGFRFVPSLLWTSFLSLLLSLLHIT